MHSRQLTPGIAKSDDCQYGLVNEKELCFRTLSDGLIPLSTNWVDLFDSLKHLDSYYLQTRHMGCRLIQRTAPIDVSWEEENISARDRAGALLLKGPQAFQAVALIDQCECCGSSGRISLHSHYNFEVLQICASADGKAEDWARAVARCIRHPSNTQPAEPSFYLPIIPGEAELLRFCHGSSMCLLADFFQTETAFQSTLVTTGVSHRTPMHPNFTRWSLDMLEVFGRNTTIQLCASTVSEVFVLQQESQLSLLVGSAEQEQLLSIDPPDEPAANETYHTILTHLLKEACGWVPSI